MARMNCGDLTRIDSEGRPTVYHGNVMNIPGLGSGEVYLIPVDNKRQEKSPDYDLKFRARDGAPFNISGCAWENEMKKGGNCFSIKFEAPGMPADDKGVIPFFVNAYPDDEQPKEAEKGKPLFFGVSWSNDRKRAGAKPPVKDAPATTDEIPY